MLRIKNKATNDNHQGYFSARIKNEFKKLNASQADIKAVLGDSQPYISALMNGKKQVGKDKAKQLYQRFKMDVLILLFGDDPIVDELTLYYKNNTLPQPNSNKPTPTSDMKNDELLNKLIASLQDQIEMKNEKIKFLEKQLDKSPKKDQDFIND